MKNISELDKSLCYGCRACEQICPKRCITIQPDNQGFNIPQLDLKSCINCGICVKSCPRIQYKEYQTIPQTYAIKHNKSDVRYNSSSGAAFTALSDAIFELNGYIAGCIFNINNQRVEFKLTNNKKERDLMRGSKYVQADTLNIYSEIKNKLDNGFYVMFVGTPCQCEGLKRFLKKQYTQLVIVDILCHSVPSPLILSETLKRYGVADKVAMRDKENGWRGTFGMKIWIKEKCITDTEYLNLFYKGLINRNSCSSCQFTTKYRCSDITIGDYWKINSVSPSFEDKLGVSLLIANTPIGKNFFSLIKKDIDYIETNLNDCVQLCMQHPTTPSRHKKNFWNDFSQYGYEYVAKKYGHYTIWETFKANYLAPISRKMGISTILRFLKKVVTNG